MDKGEKYYWIGDLNLNNFYKIKLKEYSTLKDNNRDINDEIISCGDHMERGVGKIESGTGIGGGTGTETSTGKEYGESLHVYSKNKNKNQSRDDKLILNDSNFKIDEINKLEDFNILDELDELDADNDNVNDRNYKKLYEIKSLRNKLNKKEVSDIADQKVKEMTKAKKKQGAEVLGGYKSYKNNCCLLGNLYELLDKKILMSRIKDRFMNQLDSLKLYALLINLQYITDGRVKGSSPMKSIIITGRSNISLIAANIHSALNKSYNEYGMDKEDTIVRVFWK